MPFEAALVEYCSPVLAGVKPANLFLYQQVDTEEVKREAEGWNEKLCPYGVAVKILKTCCVSGKCLVYVYRQTQLEKILSDSAVCAFLENLGYITGYSAGFLLSQLSVKLCIAREFPHEIGVFLGYPLRDVIAFMKNKGENCSCCGTWKCYGDTQEAKRYFARCSRCREIYREMFKQGAPILRLIVAA